MDEEKDADTLERDIEERGNPRPRSDQPLVIHIPVRSVPNDGEEALELSTLTITDPGRPDEEAEEVAIRIAAETGVEPDDSLTTAVRCAATWRALGADTLIYVSTYGATMVANGLIIRFLQPNIILSSFLFNLAAVLGYPNAIVLFKSLLHPPEDEVPERVRKCFAVAARYGLLPVSWAIRASISGTTLALLRDTRFSTQQTVSAITSALVGPIMYGIRSGLRRCMRGSIKIKPRGESPGQAFARTYSTRPNPADGGRPHRWTITRDMLIRVIAMTTSTVTVALTNGFSIQTYCIGGREELQAIADGGETISFEDLEEHCVGGPFTFLFRELGIAFIYGMAMMIFEPILNLGLNRIFDHFYGDPGESDDSRSSVRVEELDEEEEEEEEEEEDEESEERDTDQ